MISYNFDEIYKKNLWRSKESRSGPGSEISRTKNIRIKIPKLIKDYNIKTMFDCPCGDVNWISLIFDKIPHYVGGDISKKVINELLCENNCITKYVKQNQTQIEKLT